LNIVALLSLVYSYKQNDRGLGRLLAVASGGLGLAAATLPGAAKQTSRGLTNSSWAAILTNNSTTSILAQVT
jgi:hypothetical protein